MNLNWHHSKSLDTIHLTRPGISNPVKQSLYSLPPLSQLQNCDEGPAVEVGEKEHGGAEQLRAVPVQLPQDHHVQDVQVQYMDSGQSGT